MAGWRSRIRPSARDRGEALVALEGANIALLAVELLVGWLAPTALLFLADLPWPVQFGGSAALLVATLLVARTVQLRLRARRHRDPPGR